MSMFGGSSSTSSTSHTSSWLAQYVEPIVTNFINSYQGINYENSVVAGLTPAEQEALNRAASGGAITAGTSIAKGGASITANALNSIEGLMNGNAKTQFMSGVTGLYSAGSDFMAGQDNAIEQNVYSQMGQQFGQSAQSNMASTSLAGSSNAQNAQNSILASGANSMVQQESDLAMQMLHGAVGLTTEGMKGETSMLNTLMKEGGNIFQTGAKMAASGEKNQMNAGLFEQWFNQQVDDNNRKNDMINNNMGLINFAVLMQEILPTANIDTTTNTKSTVSNSQSGSSALMQGATAAAMLAML